MAWVPLLHEGVESLPELAAIDIALHENFMPGAGDLKIFAMRQTPKAYFTGSPQGLANLYGEMRRPQPVEEP